MKKLMLFVIIISGLMVLSSCSTSKISKNYKNSMARGLGDTVSTTVLEVKYPEITQAQVDETLIKIIEYVQTLDLSQYDKETLTALIEDQIKIEKLKFLAAKLIEFVPEDDENMEYAKEIIINACNGGLVGTAKFNPEYQLK